MDIPSLGAIVIIFALSVPILFLCHWLRVPTIVGFLLTGVVAGPYVALVKAGHEIEILAEVGVVFLLFTIGIEFSLESLLRVKKAVLLGGALQVFLTLTVAAAIARQLGYPLGEATFIGCLVALSSTAIVLKLMQERAEADSPHGRTTLAMLIFQDLIVVPMILITPFLADTSGEARPTIFLPMAQGLGIIAAVVVSARWVVPKLLYQVAHTRSHELFLLSVVVLCFGVAWLTSRVGLSLALGAFVAGLIVSESEYSHQAMGHVLPLRDVFMSFFFVSIGLLLDVGLLFRQPGSIVLITCSVLILKSLIAGGAAVLLGFPLRTALLTGLALGQVGEFAFVLSKAGLAAGLLAGDTYQFFLASSVLTMAATPFLIALAPRIADVVLRLPWPARLKAGLYPATGSLEAGDKARLHDHLLIIGFGINGRNVARATGIAGIPYVVIEMNPDTVRIERTQGVLIYYGDATQEAVLEHAGIKTARVVVVAISDAAATRRITTIARRLHPTVHIIARTRYLREMQPLYALGADEVIPEEFETSVEIFARMLTKYLVPRDEIEKCIAEVRADGYEMFRSLTRVPTSFSDLQLALADVDIRTFRVEAGSPLVGKSLAEIALRREYGVTLLAIRRDTRVLSTPGGDTELLAQDILVVLGAPEKLSGLMGLVAPEIRE